MRILANCLVLIHLYWIKMVVVGLPLGYFVEWYRPYQITIVAVTLSSWLIYGKCPFTSWENRLREKYYPMSVYKETFISHYCKRIFGIGISDHVIRVGMAIVSIGSLAISLGLLD